MRVAWMPVTTAVALAGSMVVCLSYTLALRGAFHAFVRVFPSANLENAGNTGPFSKVGGCLLLAAMALALIAISLGWIRVDAYFMLITTAKTAWGDPNPNALSSHEALGIALVFNGLLFAASLAHIYLSEISQWAENQARAQARKVRDTLAPLVSQVQSELASVGSTSKNASLMISGKVAAWVHMFNLLIDMIQKRATENGENEILEQLRPATVKSERQEFSNPALRSLTNAADAPSNRME